MAHIRWHRHDLDVSLPDELGIHEQRIGVSASPPPRQFTLLRLVDDVVQGFIRFITEGADQATVDDRPLADDELQIRGDLSGQGEQEVGILTQLMSQSHDLLFRGRGCLALLAIWFDVSDSPERSGIALQR